MLGAGITGPAFDILGMTLTVQARGDRSTAVVAHTSECRWARGLLVVGN